MCFVLVQLMVPGLNPDVSAEPGCSLAADQVSEL